MSLQKTAPTSRRTIGFVLITIGTIITLDHAGIANIGGLVRWWPLFVIGAGFVKVRQPRENGQRSSGIALLFLGTFFLLVSTLSLAKGWPLIMIAGGALLLWQAFENPPTDASAAAEPAFRSDMAFIGHLKRTVSVPDFRGGSVTAVMGGVELDLRPSTMDTSPAHLDVVAVWGGIELKIPTGWTVESEVVPIVGAFENKTRSMAVGGAGPRLVLRGYAVMGAVVISD